VQYHHKYMAATLLLASAGGVLDANAQATRAPQPTMASPTTTRPCTSIRVETPATVTLGKSAVIPLSIPMARILVNGQAAAQSSAAPSTAPNMTQGETLMRATDGIADVEVQLLSPTDLFFRGRKSGAMNVILQNTQGTCLIKDVIVTIDPGPLQSKLAELLPEERGIKVRGAENALVLSGQISNPLRLDDVVTLATAYGNGQKVVNLLRTTAPNQVMLEVKIAEVSKTLLDRLGSNVNARRLTSGDMNTFAIGSNFLSNGGGFLSALRIGRGNLILDGQKDDGLVRILAEPNIMAISGQQASFLSGGKIFIPVSQSNATSGLPMITLEEKEFGIGVKFTPTVLGDSRVNLKLVSEVSDLSQTGSPFTTINGTTSVLPSLTVRRADTTVQLNDGQSLVIAGLIKNNITETVKRFPGLGEIPVLGALARSTEFQTEQTELMFVITPRMVQPLAEAPRLPTDNHALPSRAEVYLNGALESATPVPTPQTSQPSLTPASDAASTVAPAMPGSSPTVPAPSKASPNTIDTPEDLSSNQ
jgi:pilus assembly protein CpaC